MMELKSKFYHLWAMFIGLCVTPLFGKNYKLTPGKLYQLKRNSISLFSYRNNITGIMGDCVGYLTENSIVLVLAIEPNSYNPTTMGHVKIVTHEGKIYWVCYFIDEQNMWMELSQPVC